VRHTYEPGEWMAVIASRGAALLPGTAPVEVCAAVLGHLERGAGLGLFVDALTASFGTSLSGIPDFAVVMVEEHGVRVAVRGPVSVIVTGRDGSVPFTGAGVSTWTETVITAPERVSILSPDRSAGNAPALPMAVGVAHAAAITYVFEASMSASPVAPPLAPLPAQPEQAITAVEARPENPAEASGETTLHGEPEDDVLDTTFGELWGATEIDAPTAQADAAPAPQRSPLPPAALPPEPAPAPRPEPPPPVWEPAPAPTPPIGAQEPETPQLNGMIAGVPSQWSVGPPASAAANTATPAPPPPAPEPTSVQGAPAGDHDGETVSVAAAREIVGDGAASAPAVARGRVRISSGGEYTLDRNVIVGRRPKATRITGTMPHLVAVASPEQDISRSHLEIRVEGDSVVAVDLDTTNGSIMHRNGSEPMRLHPHEPMVVVSGDVIDIGDGVSITFEELP